MPLRCYVKGCKRNNEKDKEHSFFRQPSNLELRKKWQDFAQVPGNPTHLRICSDHFESKCIRKKYPRPLLVRGAIPTLGKPSSPSISSRSDLANDEGIDNRLEFQRPALQGNCPYQHKGLILDISKATEDHFESKCIRKKYPRPLPVRGAIPTLGKPSSPSISSRSDLANDGGIDNRLEFQRSALPGNCPYQHKGLILDVQKATEDKPATIHIQSNDKIRIVISGRKCSCHN